MYIEYIYYITLTDSHGAYVIF